MSTLARTSTTVTAMSCRYRAVDHLRGRTAAVATAGATPAITATALNSGVNAVDYFGNASTYSIGSRLRLRQQVRRAADKRPPRPVAPPS